MFYDNCKNAENHVIQKICIFQFGLSTFQRSFPMCMKRPVRTFQNPTVFLPTTPNPIETHALFEHPHSQALLEPAGLAGFSSTFVDFAIAGCRTVVIDVT
jgi:hypothetical protein